MVLESLGIKLRKQRRRLGFTLDELAGRTGISKPYLSLIETGRVPNPPSDEKLRKLENVLGFTPGELLTQAHIHRTPRDVRAVLQKLLGDRARRHENLEAPRHEGTETRSGGEGVKAASTLHPQFVPSCLNVAVPAAPIDLDDAYLSGMLQEMVDHRAGNVETLSTNAVPVINRVSAGYPKDFTDLSYPRGVADDYLSCPDVHDKDAFAARVHGDSMFPKYTEGDIVIFSPALNPKNGDDCFVRFEDGHTTFKRAFFETDKGISVIRLQPRNEKYRAQTIPSAEITGLYKAVYKYQRVEDGE